MGLKDILSKAVGGLTNMSQEMQTCISVIDNANLSDRELMECVNSASQRGLLFRDTDAENINFTIREMAIKKAASDRGLL